MLDSEDLKINSFILILPSIFNEHDESSFPASANLPRLMYFKLGRSINYSVNSFKYLILLLIRILEMHHNLM